MAVTQKEIKTRLQTEVYIHNKKENFLRYVKSNIKYQYNWPGIKDKYNQYSKDAKKRMQQLELIKKDKKSVADAIGVVEDFSSNQTFNEIVQKMNTEVTEKLREGISKSQQMSSLMGKEEINIEDKVKLLDEYIKYIKDIINNYNKMDEHLITYLLNNSNGSQKRNIQNLFENSNLLKINPTAYSSFQSLNKSIEKLEYIRKRIGEGASAKEKIANFKNKEVTYNSFIYSIHFLFSNILGGIGEGLGAIYTMQRLEEFFKDMENANFTFKGSGTQKTNSKKVKKADYEIIIDTNNGKASLSFGVSAKAQNLKKGQSVKTTFQTSKLFEFINKINHEEQYLFLNSLYHNLGNKQDGYAYYFRRKIAAENFKNAVTGFEQEENVLFIQYLDTIIRVDEFFESLAKSSNEKLPTLSIKDEKSVKVDVINERGSKLKKVLKEKKLDYDLTEDTKNYLAYARSRQILNNYYNLQTQIQYTH